jgi:predicted HTH domain antitoxin
MPRKLRFGWEVPEELFDGQFREEESVRQLKEDAIVRLFDQGRISSGYAASLLGMTRRDFFELLQKRGVPFVRE